MPNAEVSGEADSAEPLAGAATTEVQRRCQREVYEEYEPDDEDDSDRRRRPVAGIVLAGADDGLRQNQ